MASRTIKKPEDVCKVMSFLRKKDREYVYLLHLSPRMQLLNKELVAIGTMTQALLHPREVYRKAIIAGAYAVILVHNHPYGISAPSEKDIEMTMKLSWIGEIIGIPLLDHIIIGRRSYRRISLPESPCGQYRGNQ